MKDLLVIVQHSDPEVLARTFDLWVEARKRLLAETSLVELSMLRTETSEGCFGLLAKKRPYPELLVVERATYNESGVMAALMRAGASRIHPFDGITEEELIARIEQCVRMFLAEDVRIKECAQAILAEETAF